MLLKNPEILLFDEPTSALDSMTEESILNQIDELSKDKTSIIIAHRLSTVMHANEILVLGGRTKEDTSLAGTVVERGTHEQLLDLGGVYYQMWMQQKSK